MKTAPYCFALAMILAGLSAARASDGQFVLCDVTFTLTKEEADATKSHYFVRKEKLSEKTPQDWTSPVDYRSGSLHLRLEVLEKPPGGAKTTWSVCYISAKGHKGGYGCTNTAVYTEKGVYEKDVKLSGIWQSDQVTWDKGIDHIALVIKDDSGGQGHAHKRSDPENFFPTKVRFTLIQVPAGETYDPAKEKDRFAPAAK